MGDYVPPSEKMGGYVPRVPHQIAPMLYTYNAVSSSVLVLMLLS